MLSVVETGNAIDHRRNNSRPETLVDDVRPIPAYREASDIWRSMTRVGASAALVLAREHPQLNFSASPKPRPLPDAARYLFRQVHSSRARVNKTFRRQARISTVEKSPGQGWSGAKTAAQIGNSLRTRRNVPESIPSKSRISAEYSPLPRSK